MGMTLQQVKNGEKPGNPVANFSKVMDRYKGQLALALPKHLNADRMTRLAVTAFSRDPNLQECSEVSIIGSIMTASTLGLEPGVNGQGYLIPYKGTCTFVPGWKGLVDLVARSGRATVWTGAVFEGDEFDYALGDSPYVKHRPGDEDDPSKLIYVYAVGRVKGADQPIVEVWSISKVWKHRDKNNKVGRSHYSYKHPEMYARKVPLLQVIKYLPSSIELSNALAAEYAAEEGRSVTIDGEFVTAGEEIAPTLDEVLEAIKGATTKEQMEQARSDAAKLKSDSDKATARDAYKARLAELKAAEQAASAKTEPEPTTPHTEGESATPDQSDSSPATADDDWGAPR